MLQSGWTARRAVIRRSGRLPLARAEAGPAVLLTNLFAFSEARVVLSLGCLLPGAGQTVTSKHETFFSTAL